VVRNQYDVGGRKNTATHQQTLHRCFDITGENNPVSVNAKLQDTGRIVAVPAARLRRVYDCELDAVPMPTLAQVTPFLPQIDMLKRFPGQHPFYADFLCQRPRTS